MSILFRKKLHLRRLVYGLKYLKNTIQNAVLQIHFLNPLARAEVGLRGDRDSVASDKHL